MIVVQIGLCSACSMSIMDESRIVALGLLSRQYCGCKCAVSLVPNRELSFFERRFLQLTGIEVLNNDY
jgi:hypothetical protein